MLPFILRGDPNPFRIVNYLKIDDSVNQQQASRDLPPKNWSRFCDSFLG